MGASRALGANIEWTHLTPLARLVLIQMCLMTKDKDTDPRYFGRRAFLLQAMGRAAPYSGADYQALTRVIRELIDAGAIRRVVRAKPGQGSEYRVNVLPVLADPETEEGPA